MGANEGWGMVPTRRLVLRWRVEKMLDGQWVTMGYFSDGAEAARCAEHGFGGMCRITRLDGEGVS